MRVLQRSRLKTQRQLEMEFSHTAVARTATPAGKTTNIMGTARSISHRMEARTITISNGVDISRTSSSRRTETMDTVLGVTIKLFVWGLFQPLLMYNYVMLMRAPGLVL